MTTIAAYLHKLMDRRPLIRAEAHEAFTALMSGEVTPVMMAAFLAALRVKGESVDELAGAAEAMREAAIPVKTDRKPLVDTCGTGGDGKSIFNVSTAAADARNCSSIACTHGPPGTCPPGAIT